MRSTILLVLSFIFFVQSYANSNDSAYHKTTSRWDALMNWNFMAIPYAGYSPETNWQFGATGVYYFRTTPTNKQYSDLNFDLGYSLNRQWYVNANTRIYFNTATRWYLDAYLSAKLYPDLYFGIGNSKDDIIVPAVRYTSNFVDLKGQPNFHISSHWLLGTYLRLRYENSILPDSVPLPNVNGFGRSFFLGIGASVSYDTRTNSYYPLRGMFFKTSVTYNQQFISDHNSSALVQIDYRHFVPLYKELIFAYNFRADFSAGNNIPFQFLPTIGGQDLVRGIRQNKFKDDCLFALQAELRIPIWRFLKATVFGSIGDVYNYHQWNWAVPKIGYGIGLRACIHQANTNIRFDVARHNYGNDWSFYFTVKEAF